MYRFCLKSTLKYLVKMLVYFADEYLNMQKMNPTNGLFIEWTIMSKVHIIWENKPILSIKIATQIKF